MNNSIAHKSHEIAVVGNSSGTINTIDGALAAIVISKDQDTSNVAKSVSIVCDMADGFTVTFGPLVVGNTPTILHPRKQAVASDLSTAIAGVYEPYYLTGKAVITVTAGDSNDVTRVKLVTVP